MRMRRWWLGAALACTWTVAAVAIAAAAPAAQPPDDGSIRIIIYTDPDALPDDPPPAPPTVPDPPTPPEQPPAELPRTGETRGALAAGAGGLATALLGVALTLIARRRATDR